MQQALQRSSLVPSGFVVESACFEGDKAVIAVRATRSVGQCPFCGTVSRRVHSRYRRHVTDLPLSGRIVQLLVIARRFRCDAVLCGRQIFTERFPEGGLAPSARRTARLDSIVHHLGLVLGGRPAAGFAKRLMLPVSKDTLLRVVRRRSRPPADPLKVIGIDDWAWRPNHRYASIVCNLEKRRIVTLLPDREPATAQAWLAAHPTIAIVARDRGGGYGEAAAKALPHATQVADRWHLMENASRAFLDAVRKSMRQIRTVIGATRIDPKLLTAAERLQYEGYLRREETNEAILALSKSGTPIKKIVRQTGHSRKLVRQVIRGERHDVFRTRESSLDQHLLWLDDQWASGCQNGAELWRRLKTRGFRGPLRVISEWATRRRRAEKTDAQNLQRIPSARTIARLMTIGRDSLTKVETVTVAAIETGVPTLVEAREIIAEFHLMIRRKVEARLTQWMERARA
jgi:transposase